MKIYQARAIKTKLPMRSSSGLKYGGQVGCDKPARQPFRTFLAGGLIAVTLAFPCVRASGQGTNVGQTDVVGAAVERRKAARQAGQPAAQGSAAFNGAAMVAAGAGGSPAGPQTPGPASGCPGFVGQVFSLLDTNNAAANDPNLYSALLSFPQDTNTGPNLQIMLYQTNVILIAANHFDYSSDTRDFALVICDSVNIPLWKNIDMFAPPPAQDGWLIQGTVPNSSVTDPMYLEISNISLACEAFFRAIPYAGPQIQLSGPVQYDTVSNTVSLQVTIRDLSGVNQTNESLLAMVNGLPARYALGPSNLISLDTRYAPNGYQEIEVAQSSMATVYDPNNAPLDVQMSYSSVSNLVLDFENMAFLVNQSDYSDPDYGTNYIEFGLAQGDWVTISISDPLNGAILLNYSNSFAPGIVTIAWNYTLADGVTPYTNDTYAVSFVAADPATLVVTNHVGRGSVRDATGVILSYAQEPNNYFLNDEADTYIHGGLMYFYEDIYSTLLSTTEYTVAQIGPDRDYVEFQVDTASRPNGWQAWFLQNLTNTLFSDVTFGPGHGSSTAIGSNFGEVVGAAAIKGAASSVGNNWRLRKVALWSCLATSIAPTATSVPPLPDAFGIRPGSIQTAGIMRKNVGLFFQKELNQQANNAEMEYGFDELWVTGPNAYPGGCDPTYTFGWAFRKARQRYAFWDDAGPIIIGCQYLPYTGIYDDTLATGNFAPVHN